MARARERAEAHNERGNDLEEAGRTEEAAREYQRASEIDPQWAAPHYNLGLIYKYAGDWQRSLECNRRAAELAPSDEASLWNLGIAATALADWAEARRAWRACGIAIPPGDGPIDFPCGSNPIRLHPDGSPEVVWSRRLDPARARLQNIPFAESGFRWGDVVLNDGAPNGYRMLRDKEVPVFDCLALLRPSPYSTFIAKADAPSEAADALAEIAAARELAAEDWNTSIEILCKACSEGRPHGRHDHTPAPIKGPRKLAIAARNREDAERLLADWRSQWHAARVLSLELVLAA
jgi:tetratricopeptide (TPR) repeat protein